MRGRPVLGSFTPWGGPPVELEERLADIGDLLANVAEQLERLTAEFASEVSLFTGEPDKHRRPHGWNDRARLRASVAEEVPVVIVVHDHQADHLVLLHQALGPANPLMIELHFRTFLATSRLSSVSRGAPDSTATGRFAPTDEHRIDDHRRTPC